MAFAGFLVWLSLPVMLRWMTFVPSAAWSTWRWIPATLLGLGLGAWAGHWLQQRARTAGKLSPFTTVAMSYALVPLCLSLLAWWNVGYVLPGLLTQLLGTREHEVAALRKVYHEHVRRSLDCDYRVEGPPFVDSREGYYCAWEWEWTALPAAGEMEIHFRSTWFGRRYRFIAPHEASLHRPA